MEGETVAAAIGTFLGALIATFLLSRLFLWLLRSRVAGFTRLAVAHVLSLVVVFVAAGFGYADEAGFKADAIVPYLIPETIWLVFDLWRLTRRRPTSA